MIRNLQYLMLYLLGLSNKTIIDIMMNVDEGDLATLFGEAYISIQYKYNIDLSKYGEVLTDKERVYVARRRAMMIIEKNKELGIRMLIFKSRYYPVQLAKIENPPAIIYAKGAGIVKDDNKSIAVVGTRKPTKFGGSAAHLLSDKLTKEGFTIVSGLAIGIDTFAHTACLNAGGKTIAVLAHGLDSVYPEENIKLANRILNSGGTLVSEYPVGTKPDKFRFVARNRIIASLAQGVLVCESKEKSGTMHTVNEALIQNKKIFCPIPAGRGISTEGLYILLEKGQAIGVKNISEYNIIVEELGYTIKNDIKLINSKKEAALKQIIDCDIDLLNLTQSNEYNKRTSIAVQDKLYTEFKKILKENNLTGKEFFTGVMYQVVNNYNRGGNKNE